MDAFNPHSDTELPRHTSYAPPSLQPTVLAALLAHRPRWDLPSHLWWQLILRMTVTLSGTAIVQPCSVSLWTFSTDSARKTVSEETRPFLPPVTIYTFPLKTGLLLRLNDCGVFPDPWPGWPPFLWELSLFPYLHSYSWATQIPSPHSFSTVGHFCHQPCTSLLLLLDPHRLSLPTILAWSPHAKKMILALTFVSISLPGVEFLSLISIFLTLR